MSHLPPPLRFLALIVGGWIAIRVVVLAPDWSGEPSEAAALENPLAPAAPSQATSWARPRPAEAMVPLRGVGVERVFDLAARDGSPHQAATGASRMPQPPWLAAPAPQAFRGAAQSALALPPPPGLAQLFPTAAPSRERRLAGSAWLFVRDGAAAPALAPAGELGGSQAGLRVTYRLAGRRAPLALSGRIYLPLERPDGAEAAVGLDWRPVAGVPLHLLAERREGLGRDGRSDFALTLYGGGERRLGPVRVEAWGQAGAVGLENPDLFADGFVRATVRLGPLEAGPAVWGGAQPGAARLDVGPHVSARLPVAGANLRVMAEWRLRAAGDATPGSGPALTLATDF